jgi:predicted small lipoprotein YifL
VRPLSHAVCAVIAGGALLALGGCGQTGNLYLPTEPAAANRATLPQSLWPVMPERNKDVTHPPTTAPSTTKTPAAQ